MFSQVEQDVLRRLKKAFNNFFRRVREHAKEKGYPRFKAEGRYNSFTYPQSGFKLEGTRLTLSKIPGAVVNLREEFLHKVSRELVDSADAIIFEDLSIPNMLKNHTLAKHISDVSWGKLIQYTQSKAERAGKSVVLVDPMNTSQLCSGCGAMIPKDLSERIHNCPHCGLVLDRDHNAALNILALGLRVLACGELPSGLDARLSKRQLCEAGSPGL